MPHRNEWNKSKHKPDSTTESKQENNVLQWPAVMKRTWGDAQGNLQSF